MKDGPMPILQERLGWKKMLFLLQLVLASFCLKWMFPFQTDENFVYNGRHNSTNITILLWYWPFNAHYSLEGDVCLEHYRISGCHLVDNRSLYSVAEIVVFHHHELKMRRQMLPHHLPRTASQRWVWLSLEAPENSGNLREYAGVFNLTMSYHPYADITVPYGRTVPKENHDKSHFIHSTNKTDLACWVVSNYKKHHKRSAVYNELRKTIKVQVYGKATKRPLDEEALLTTLSHCHFYLAFENVESPHYITEKLWRNSFLAGAVPVVLGPPRSHYEAVAPTHSFIHVNDFDSIEELGRFLIELARDSERYKEYFAWHQHSSIKLYTDWRERLCNICVVYDKLPYHSTHKHLGGWPSNDDKG